ncbi:MAG TPA: hypothetical protein VKS60_12740 [Stellaceae bacterium]|nr:hypothetical protein [Stellaceae bacterium]
MRPLDSHIRLRKWQLDEARRRVAALVRLEEQFRADRARLEIELAAEHAAGMLPDVQLFERRDKLDCSLAEVAGQLGQAREVLSDASAELQRSERAVRAVEKHVRRKRDRGLPRPGLPLGLQPHQAE